ncbi:MAG: di-trans,poly-cis-decaprenylcistransferase [Euryarchaeota archaeon]|nr:di-trans,poly-cis-decaprenylcistransferase [Euryarchaeota archaeon]
MGVLKPIYKLYEWYISRNFKPENMPKHIAIIMDGNRRFSRIRGNMGTIEGHKRGINTLESVLDWCVDLGIEIVTVYAFSIENFKRPEHEVEGLMKLFKENFENIAKNKKIQRNKVRVKAVGKLELLPEDVRDAIKIAEDSTSTHNKRLVNIAIGYDGRLEIVDAIKKISKDIREGKLNPDEIDEDVVNGKLYTAGLEDPNLIIRTSGEERLSGFLLWQSSYSELYFCDSLWPELRKVDFLRALRSYQQRERRFGV